MKTSELTGTALNWAVAKCEGMENQSGMWAGDKWVGIPYITDWAQGGPIIEQEKIEWQWLPATNPLHRYGARKPSLGGQHRTFCMDGPTILIAAMRCYVASKLGDDVEVPEGLL